MSLRLDDLQNGYYLWQNPKGFCFGIDAVLLAHYVRLREADRVLDMGCGNGVIPILMCARAPAGVSITGIEIQEEAAELAEKNIRYNHLEEKIAIYQGDLNEAKDIFGSQTFNAVTCNPPYWKKGSGYVSLGDARAIARHEIYCNLEGVIRAAAAVLKTNGRLAMIHSPERIPEMIRHLAGCGMAMKRMRLIYPYADKEPTMVLIEAVKGGKEGLKVESPLIIYEAEGCYTEEVLKIYGKETT